MVFPFSVTWWQSFITGRFFCGHVCQQSVFSVGSISMNGFLIFACSPEIDLWPVQGVPRHSHGGWRYSPAPLQPGNKKAFVSIYATNILKVLQTSHYPDRKSTGLTNITLKILQGAKESKSSTSNWRNPQFKRLEMQLPAHTKHCTNRVHLPH